MPDRSIFHPRRARAALALAAAAALAGCGFNVREELGLVGKGPDEFTVVVNRPLAMPDTMPSDPSQLPAPKPGASSRVVPEPTLEAQQALAGGLMVPAGESAGAEAPSAGEEAMLAAAKADGDSDIRDVMEADIERAKDDQRILDRMLGREIKGVEPAPLDAKAEADRLVAERAAKRDEMMRAAETEEGPEDLAPRDAEAGAAEPAEDGAAE